MCRGECHLVDPIPEITRDSTRQLDLPGDQLPNRRDSVNRGQGKVVSLVRRLSEFTNWARHRSFLLGARRAKLVSG